VCNRQGPWDRRQGIRDVHGPVAGARASGGGNGQNRLGMLSGPVCLFFIFLSIPRRRRRWRRRRRRRRRRCTRALPSSSSPCLHPAPIVSGRWNAPVRVRVTAAAHKRFFLRLPRLAVAFKMK